jgi:hypothetical protein
MNLRTPILSVVLALAISTPSAKAASAATCADCFQANQTDSSAQAGRRVSSPTLPPEYLGTFPPGMDENTYVQTLIGNLKLQLMTMWKTRGNEKIFLNHPQFDKPVPVTVNLRRNTAGELIQAPLVVVLVGIHGNGEDDAFDRYITKHLSDLGNHVLLLPNSFSDNYTQAKPHFPATSMLAEVKISYDMIHMIRDQGVLPPNKISETRLLGFSYGGIVAGIFASRSVLYDQQAGRPRTVDGDVTIISPPIHLRHGQRQLDLLIQSYENSTSMENVSAFTSLLQVKKMTEAQARIIMGSKFESSLTATLMNLKTGAASLRDPDFPDQAPGQMVTNYSDVPKSSGDRHYRNFKKDARYEIAMGKYTKSDPFYDGPTAYLSGWIHANQEINGPPISMVASKDDMLNVVDLEEFNHFPLSAEKGNLNLFEHGGHGGFVFTDWFAGFIRARFGN